MGLKSGKSDGQKQEKTQATTLDGLWLCVLMGPLGLEPRTNKL